MRVALSRGYTSDFLLAQVMRFFQISSRPQREKVATRVTSSSEFGDKLKAERIAHFKRLFLRHRIFCLRPPLLFLLKPESRFRPLISLAKYFSVALQGQKVAKISILATFFLRFFHLSRRQFEGGYTCDFHLALATRQNLKKSHHLREQKIARVAAALNLIMKVRLSAKLFI